jgi:predicted Zn-dependent protease
VETAEHVTFCERLATIPRMVATAQGRALGDTSDLVSRVERTTHEAEGRMTRLEQLRTLIADDPHDAMLRFALGNEYFQQGQYAEAIESLRAAIHIDPEYAFVYIQLARAYEKSGQIDLARQTVEAGRGPAVRNGDPNLMRQLDEIAGRLPA